MGYSQKEWPAKETSGAKHLATGGKEARLPTLAKLTVAQSHIHPAEVLPQRKTPPEVRPAGVQEGSRDRGLKPDLNDILIYFVLRASDASR